MKWLLWYITVIIVAVFLYFMGWMFLWVLNGQPDITELRNFIDDVVSAPWVAMIGVVAQYFVDKNKNNIPDFMEEASKTSNEDKESEDKDSE